MEHTTDRLFWTLTSVIVGALILTIGIKAFPTTTQSIFQPISGVMKQADTATNNVQKATDTINSSINAPTAQSLSMDVTDNGDGTGSISNYYGPDNVDVTIPPYVRVGNKTLKITAITNGANNNHTFKGDGAFAGAGINSVTIPDTVTYIYYQAFCNNHITSVTIPDSVVNLGYGVFAWNPIKSVTMSKNIQSIGGAAFSHNDLTSITLPKGLSDIKDGAFDNNVTINRE